MNHLMIGLGGTGGKVIAATRRLIYQHHGSAEPNSVALDFLYIDTSDDDTRVARMGEPLKESDLMWRTLGHSVQLAPAQIVYMSNSGLGQIIEKNEEFPRIASWMGDNERWRSYWVSRPGEMKAAGQIRRIGRTVLAQNIDAVSAAIRSRMDAKRSPINEWTFHVFAGLAGGTGSGAFLDIVGQLRSLSQGRNAKILLYVVLPEAQDSAWATGNYHGNGYAALAELNATLVERLKLTNLADQHLSQYRDLGVDNTFIITNENQARHQVGLERELPAIIAETFFQIVVASGDARVHGTDAAGQSGADQRAWRDEITGENRDSLYEKDDPDNPTAPPFDRANRFIGFGIKRISVPHQEVREYSSLVFMRQFVLQSLNNSWADGEGFTDARKPFDSAAHVRTAAHQEKWGLADAHLMLEKKLLDNDPDRWGRLADDFQSAMNGKVSEIVKTIRDKMDWPRNLDEFSRQFYEQRFRAFGVSTFYTNARRSIEDRARHIVRDRFGSDLFQKWQIGEFSVTDIRRIVDEQIVDATQRNEQANASIEKYGKQSVDAAAAVAKIRAEYNSKGPLNLLYDRKRALETMGAKLAERYTADAYVEAQGFKQQMLASILTFLQELREDVDVMAQRFEETLAYIEPQLASRVDASATNTPRSHQFKFFDARHIRTLFKRFEQNQKLQQSQTGVLRDHLVGLIGAQPGFLQFRNKITKGMINAELEAIAEKEAAGALADLDNERDRILDASIVQKLYEEYGSRDDELKKFLADRVAEAQPFAAMDQGEMTRGQGIQVRKTIVAFIPSLAEQKNDQLRAFHGKLKEALENSSQTGRVHVSETTGQGEQIVILSLVSQFPLRALSALPFLKEKYEEIAKGPKRDYVPIHLYLEGTGDDLPSLFAAGPDVYRNKAAPYWLIAQCRDMLHERPDKDGRPEIVLRFHDEEQDGDLRFIHLAKSIEDKTAKMTITQCMTLIKVVSNELDKITHVDDRKALRVKLGEIRNAALEKYNNNENHPAFVQIEAAVGAARKLVGS